MVPCGKLIGMRKGSSQELQYAVDGINQDKGLVNMLTSLGIEVRRSQKFVLYAQKIAELVRPSDIRFYNRNRNHFARKFKL